MRYAKEAGRLIRDGPEDDEPSILKASVGILLYWRVWAGVFTLWVGLNAVTLLTGPEDALMAGWAVGFVTGVVELQVMRDD